MEVRSCAGKVCPVWRFSFFGLRDFCAARFGSESRYHDAGAKRRQGQADPQRSHQCAGRTGLHGSPRKHVRGAPRPVWPQWRGNRQYRLCRLPPLPGQGPHRVHRQGPQHHSSVADRGGWLGFFPRGIVITLYNGDHGWTFDRSGVNELPATSISEFQEQAKRDVDNLLRLRLKEPGMAVRFGGNDTVDLKQVDWVEITDSQERKFRLAVDRSTHLLVRSAVITKDEETQQLNEDVSI